MSIRPLKELIDDAFKDLKRLQDGDKLLPRTGEDFIDDHLGCILPGDVILLSALSGQGKTETLQRMKKNILSETVNPNAKNYIFCDFSLEMKVFNLILRGAANTTGKKKSKVLFEVFSEEEKLLVKSYYESLNDDRQFISQTPTSPKEFYDLVSEFLTTHSDKEAVFISVDHVMLLSGHDKQALLEQLCEYVNQLKLKFGNVYFILISQNNRSLLSRISEKNNNAAPNAGDVFGSSFLDQLCSFNAILYNPFKMGISQYMKVNPDRYDYLSAHFGDEDSKGKVSFNTESKIFVHLIKTRESDNPFRDIYVIEMNISEEEKAKLKEPIKSNSITIPNLSKTNTVAAVFESPLDVKPVSFDSLKDVFEPIALPGGLDKEPF